MTESHPFLYRLPRFDIAFYLEFVVEGRTVHGRCKNLSDAGLLASFDSPVGRKPAGLVRLEPPGLTVELRAEVTHTDGLDAGLSFIFASEEERQMIRALVKAAIQVGEQRLPRA